MLPREISNEESPSEGTSFQNVPLDSQIQSNTKKQTVLAWVNKTISVYSMSVENLTTDLSDGVVLFRLLEVLTLKSFKGWNQEPKDMMDKLNNLNMVLKLLYYFGIKISGISCEDLYTGNENISMAILLLLLKKFTPNQPQGSQVVEPNVQSNNESDVTNNDIPPGPPVDEIHEDSTSNNPPSNNDYIPQPQPFIPTPGTENIIPQENKLVNDIDLPFDDVTETIDTAPSEVVEDDKINVQATELQPVNPLSNTNQTQIPVIEMGDRIQQVPLKFPKVPPKVSPNVKKKMPLKVMPKKIPAKIMPKMNNPHGPKGMPKKQPLKVPPVPVEVNNRPQSILPQTPTPHQVLNPPQSNSQVQDPQPEKIQQEVDLSVEWKSESQNNENIEIDFSPSVPGSQSEATQRRRRASTVSNINTNVFDLDAFSDMEDLLQGLADSLENN